MTPSDKRLDPAVLALLVLTAALMGVRLYAARLVGFGDSEALYASYALHPQPAYLDHPGLVGVFASALGGGVIPSPQAAHVATAALATAFPWLVVIVARGMGAEVRPAAIAGLVTAAAPEIAVGLFAMTPDLLLAFLWLAFLGIASMALASPASSGRAAAGFLVAGVIAGAAATAKVTGALLLPVLVWVAWRDGAHKRTVWPYLGALAGAVPLVPIARYEASRGFPMLHHRLVDTQHAAGFSLRNLGALLGGQLVYVSPVIVVLAVWAARDLFRKRNDDAASRLLFASFAFPGALLVVLCLWSRVAEPHWLAPPLLSLPLFAARAGLATPPQRLRRTTIAAVATGLALAVGVYAWVLMPSLLRLAPKSYDPTVDISNELFGWAQAAQSVDEMSGDVKTGLGPDADVFVVGPTWMVCAQLQANLPSAQVGCATKTRSDFDDWAPRARWQRADAIVFVTDDRVPVDPATLAEGFRVERSERVSVLRGGHVARTFRLTLLQRRAAA
ncbi:MAG TPA: hypothetical protein VLM85_02110 [Polyangiaceae bacterium]|nr:hypothetical protein [Polyangiaceae bacterium]